MVLTHVGVPLMISDQLRDALDASNPLGDVLGLFVSFTQLKVFCHFLVYSSIFFCTSFLLETH